MSCNHRHIVLHRNDVEDHVIDHGTSEMTCSCHPGIICPVCDWGVLNDVCMVYAPGDLVDSHSIRPPDTLLN